MCMRSGRCCNRHCDHACMQPGDYDCTCRRSCNSSNALLTMLSWLVVGALFYFSITVCL
jgi:hypothetical protein